MAEVLVEEMVAGLAACGGGRKKKNKRRKYAEGKGRPRGGCPYHRWGFGFVGRLRSRLFVEEKGFCGGFNSWRRSGESYRKLTGKEGKWEQGEGWCFVIFGPDFLLPQVIKSTFIYRRWKRAILSTLEKNCSPWFGWEGSQPLAQSRHGALSNC